jgi:hypothetical protein
VIARRVLVLALVEAALLCAVPQIAAAIGPRGVYSWYFRTADGSIDQSVPEVVETNDGPTESFEQQDSISLPGPMDTVASVFTAGAVDLRTRRFGVAAVAAAQANPWDPENPPPNPKLVEAGATAEVGIADRVFLYSPSRPPGALIGFTVQPALITGDVFVPSEALGTGVAQVLFNFAIEQVAIGGGGFSLVRNHEVTLATGGTERWNAIELLGQNAFGGPLILAPNLKVYDFALLMRVSLAAGSNVFPAFRPPLASSEAELNRTMVWNGLGDFQDEFGNPLTDVVLESEAGFDWVTVPEPGPLGTALLALTTLHAVARRRCRVVMAPGGPSISSTRSAAPTPIRASASGSAARA